MPVVLPTLHCLKFPWSVTIVPSAVKANTTCRDNPTGTVGGRPYAQGAPVLVGRGHVVARSRSIRLLQMPD
jgi:hypothetical protein